jgi:hypothetical protein
LIAGELYPFAASVPRDCYSLAERKRPLQAPARDFLYLKVLIIAHKKSEWKHKFGDLWFKNLTIS